MGKVIAIATQKGGVGKTTTTIELGTNLTLLGKKVLVVDLDQQGDTTRSVNGMLTNGIYQVLNVESYIKDVIQKTPYFDLICSSRQLSSVDRIFTDRDDIYILADALSDIKDEYDYILIDNNPDLGMLFTMSIVAADYVIIPTECDRNSLNGIRETEAIINKLRNNRNKDSKAEILGYILTKKESTNVHIIAFDELEELAEEKDEKPFVTYITKGIKVSESKITCVPVSYAYKGCTQAREYFATAEEIIHRVEE